jgi:hypothetical protein
MFYTQRNLRDRVCALEREIEELKERQVTGIRVYEDLPKSVLSYSLGMGRDSKVIPFEEAIRRLAEIVGHEFVFTPGTLSKVTLEEKRGTDET